MQLLNHRDHIVDIRISRIIIEALLASPMSPLIQSENATVLCQPLCCTLPFVASPSQAVQQEEGWATTSEIDATEADVIDIQKKAFPDRHIWTCLRNPIYMVFTLHEGMCRR